MPSWTLKSTATKMLHSLAHAPSQPRERKTSIDVHVHTQRSFFVEPPAGRECSHVGHRHRLRPPYAVPPKYEKEFARPRPKPLSISHSLPSLPIVAFQDTRLGRTNSILNFAEIRTDENVYPAVDEKEKGKGQLVDRRRRYGMTCYPDGVREELRRTRTRSRSPRLAKLDVNTPSPRFISHKSSASNSPSVYSDASGYGEQITVSSAKAEFNFEPPSWFSDHTSRSEEDRRGSRHTRSSSEISSADMKRILIGIDAQHSPNEPSSAHVPSTAKSWETFRVPSIPPSPVESTSSEAAPVPPRDPRLPPADYLLYKDMYDDAMIGLHGKLPAEWVAYTHRHYAGPSRI